ncbi:MAG TPA: prolipoprotein diacylglyceryl transferase [Telluria sp.]|nr:prolipoprotein diacylglyceryl transferase [Telluria sp.]
MSFPFLSDLVKAISGYDLPLPLPMFGIFVAIATLVAAGLLRREMARLHAAGRIGTVRTRVKAKDGTVTEVDVPPQDVVPDLTVVVMFAGIIGARVFHILEHTDQFMADPWSMILTRSGLSIFGGLIVGTLAGLVCVRRWKLPLRPLLDAVAPAMMLGYGIGRIGCQVSGDGDWGSAANMALKPDWLPTWLFAQTYDNNIFGEVIAAPGVYPAPIYETAMALVCFAVLWNMRKHPFLSGWLFSVYLLFAGIERLLIEQIRVNPVLHVAGFNATQAEMIAATLIVLGLAGVALLSRRDVRRPVTA